MRLTYAFLLVMLSAFACAQPASKASEVESIYPDAKALYLDIHQNPEQHRRPDGLELVQQIEAKSADIEHERVWNEPWAGDSPSLSEYDQDVFPGRRLGLPGTHKKRPRIVRNT